MVLFGWLVCILLFVCLGFFPLLFFHDRLEFFLSLEPIVNMYLYFTYSAIAFCDLRIFSFTCFLENIVFFPLNYFQKT